MLIMENLHYLHLGSDVTVHTDNIIGIFDIERTTVKSSFKSSSRGGQSVNDFLRVSQKSGKIYYVSLDLPKSFIVTANRKKSSLENVVYVSNVSTLTLKKRCGII